MIRIIFTVIVVLAPASFASAQIKSVYTSLDQKQCKPMRPVSDRNGIYTYNKRCSGVGGYWLAMDASADANDEHQWIAVVAPTGKKFDAGTGPVAYDTLGKSAEWRVRNGKPVALIIRFDLRGELRGTVTKSVWAVSKIFRSKSCLVATVDRGKDPIGQARKLADSSASKPCIPSEIAKLVF